MSYLFNNLANKKVHLKSTLIYIVAIFTLFASGACNTGKDCVVYVNSYHKGYKPSDEVAMGITEEFPADNYDLEIFYIDSKRHTSPEYLSEKIDSISQAIIKLNPKVLIVSDDYAVKYLVKPFFDLSDIPVVFCGVNWSASQYNLSGSHITGMLEVLPLPESIRFIKSYYSELKKIAVVSENSLSEKNNTLLLDTLYKNNGLEPTYFLVNTFEEWKKSFKSANEQADIVYLPTNGAINDWNNEDAIRYIEENIKKPVFTCDDFMMDYCVFGFTKVPIEQGIWAAQTAKKILKGISPSQIALTQNKQTIRFINTKMSKLIGFKPDSDWLKSAQKFNSSNPKL